MAGIFPNIGVSRLLADNAVDADTVPETAELFYPGNLCVQRFDPAALNAIMSELLNAVNETGVVYDPTVLNNLAQGLSGTVTANRSIRQAVDDQTLPRGEFVVSATGQILFNLTGGAVVLSGTSTAILRDTDGLTELNSTFLNGLPSSAFVQNTDTYSRFEQTDVVLQNAMGANAESITFTWNDGGAGVSESVLSRIETYRFLDVLHGSLEMTSPNVFMQIDGDDIVECVFEDFENFLIRQGIITTGINRSTYCMGTMRFSRTGEDYPIMPGECTVSSAGNLTVRSLDRRYSNPGGVVEFAENAVVRVNFTARVT